VYFRSRGSNNRPFVSGSDPSAQCAAVQLRRLGIISWHADQTTDEEEEGDRFGWVVYIFYSRHAIQLNEPIYTHTRTHTELARLSVVLSELTRHNEDISCLLHGCGGVREARLRGVDWIVRVEHLGVPVIPVSADGCAERYSTSVQQGKRPRPLCKISLAFDHPSLSWSWYVTVLHHQKMASAKK
jgi:hypothetical protein